MGVLKRPIIRTTDGKAMPAAKLGSRLLLVVLLLAAVLLSFAGYRSSRTRSSAKHGGSVSGLAASGWPSHRADAQNTGLGSGSGAVGRIKWVFHTGSVIASTPVVGRDGTVYVWSCDGNLYAVDSASGTEKWRAATEKPSAIHYDTPSPAVLDDGTVVIGAPDGNVYAFDGVTGDERWRFGAGAEIRSSPGVGVDGTLYMATWETPTVSWWNRLRFVAFNKYPLGGRLYALHPRTGRKLWEVRELGQMQSSPAIGHDGTVYVGSNMRGVVAIDGKSGNIRWEALNSAGTPAVGTDGTVYVDGRDACVYALDGATGAVVWRAQTGGQILSPLAIGPNGLVYVGSSKGKLFAFDARTGAPEWTLEAGGEAMPTPVLSSDGTVYVHAFRGGVGQLLAVDGGSGTIDWQIPKGGGSVNAAIADDGTLYIGSWDGGLYAIE